MLPNTRGVQFWAGIGGALAEVAEDAARLVQKTLKSRRAPGGLTRRPGSDSPVWNAFVILLRAELQSYGTKARLARYLGIPRQRLNDFLTGRCRLPDAELTLRLCHWLAERRAGRDPSL